MYIWDACNTSYKVIKLKNIYLIFFSFNNKIISNILQEIYSNINMQGYY